MSSKNLERTSKFISLILRHNPAVIGITLDSHGWADVDELINGVSKKYPLDREILSQIVANDKKGRYSFSEDGQHIRANQGHSINVDVDLQQKDPPEILYHGTGEKSAPSIEAQGLTPQTRLYVHLSLTPEDARKVGQRHGRPVIYAVKSGDMAKSGHNFYISANGVWLVKNVPPEFLERV
ncbi:MAG: RNA 2'-phosphotransferase [Synergistaceae bacterium]|nr:RNA 2'-phosphotransferase [Synergistaceae bacterium]